MLNFNNFCYFKFGVEFVPRFSSLNNSTRWFRFLNKNNSLSMYSLTIREGKELDLGVEYIYIM